MIIFARLASQLGSALCKNELEEEARLGSFEAREPRANFLALVACSSKAHHQIAARATRPRQ
jgi:hypothetical protein